MDTLFHRHCQVLLLHRHHLAFAMAMLELDANATVAVKLADCALLLVQLWRGVKVDKFDPGPQLGVGVA
jgi:hypothetical protein